MGEPASASTVPAGTDNPQTPPEQRTCRDCNETKVVSPETWPYRSRAKGKPYHAHGMRCLLCEAARKKQYEDRRGQVAALVAEDPPKDSPAVKPKKSDARTDEVEQAKLDAAKSLKLGSRVLNQSAADVLARILMWAEDEQDENHRWAIQFLAERILPRKLYEELGGQAAGVGQLSDKRPVFNIQIVQAVPDQPAGRILEGHAITVEALPSPQE